MEILIATTNEGKKKGMIEALGSIDGCTFKTLKDFNPIEDREETGQSFEENAFQKAEYYAHKTGCITLAEDAGITLEAFPNKFGVHTKRTISNTADDNEWLSKFLDIIMPEKNRNATFHSHYVLYDPQTKKHYTTSGTLSGILVDFPQAPLEKGIPLSSLFIPHNEDEVILNLSPRKRKKISHRGKAGVLMAQILQKKDLFM